MDGDPIYEEMRAQADEAARRAFFSNPEVVRRQREVNDLIERALDPDDEYDGHHGTDRSADSLAWLRDNDLANYERILAKIAAEGGVPDAH